MQVHCIPDNPYAVSGVLNTKRARFDIVTKSQSEDVKRTPLNLALILDRSGSMESGDKFTFAKRAVVNVLNLLHDDDVVHLVAYDTDVSVVFENARAATRQYLYTIVDNLRTAGSTNISGALEVGAELLNKYTHEGYARRMFLFSDGQANVGKKTRPQLTALVAGFNQQGIITDSFGIGADFDSEIMKGIADAGGARFFFLETAQVIESLVNKALASVFRVLGSQARLLIHGVNGAVVTKIWGHEDTAAGARIGDLHANNLRSILCEFTTTGVPNGSGKEVEMLAYELRYAPPQNLNGEPTVIKNTLSLKFVDDETLVGDIDPRVRTIHATQKSADMDLKISELVRNRKRTEAIELVKEQMQLLQDVQQFDDQRGIIALLLRMAENMHNKLKDKDVNDEIIRQGCSHKAYMQRQNSCSEMEMYDE